MAKAPNFYEVLTKAITDLADHGFDSEERLETWTERIRRAALIALPSEESLTKMLRDALVARFKKLVDDGEIAKHHPGVSRFTIKNLRPQMKDELDKRIMASAQLIKLNRKRAIDATLQRFTGWATSIPAGGTKQTDKAKTKADIRKSLASLPFEERRVLIDQGHKLTASISEVIANDNGAIAVIWHSHWRQPGYDYREDHKERDEQVYAIRGNRALQLGLMKAGPAGYYDQITKVGEEPFCRCYAQWIYSIRDLPDDMLTAKGRKALADAKAKIAAM